VLLEIYESLIATSIGILGMEGSSLVADDNINNPIWRTLEIGGELG